jgi:hypothetical protein
MARNLRAVALRAASASLLVSRWLTESDVTHVIVKGPALAALYPDNDRDFIDLDVLVPPAQMVDAIQIFEAHGAAVLESQDWPRPDRIGELTLGLPSGVAIDLHAELIHHENVRRDFRFGTDRLLARLTTAEVLGESIPVLDPNDSLTYVAVHAAVSGGDRLIWLADLDALVRHSEIRWPILIERAREARAALVVAVMLERASMVLGTPVPEAVAAELRRGGVLWARLLAEFERRRPTASNYARNVRGQVLVRATRSSTIKSAVTLLRLIWTDVIVLVLRNPGHPWRRSLREWMGRSL